MRLMLHAPSFTYHHQPIEGFVHIQPQLIRPPCPPTHLLFKWSLVLTQNFFLPLSHSLTFLYLSSQNSGDVSRVKHTTAKFMAGLVVAVPGIIDLCIKYGQFLKEKVDLYRDMSAIVKLNLFVVQLVGGELHTLLSFFHSIDGQMTPTFKDEIRQLFQVLRDLLEKIIAEFPSSGPGTLKKLSFSFHGKKSIDKACGELEQWHSRFLRRAVVFLFFGGHDITDSTNVVAGQNRAISRIKRIRSVVTDSDPAKGTPKLQLDDFDSTTTFQQLDDSNIYVTNGGSELIEFREYDSSADPIQINATRSTVRDFAAKLHRADPSVMGLLGCNGYSAEPLAHRFALRFQYPAEKTNPHTLHHLLVHESNKSPGIRHSISDRIHLACKLASAVLYLHSCDFVHKNIRPANILIFDPIAIKGTDPTITYPDAVGEPYLVGFDSVRKADGKSNMIRVEEWQKNIYLHPDRHRMAPGDEFTMRHDIYSLGVVLLEISLWGSFTDLGSRGIGRYLWESLEKNKEKLREPGKLKDKYLQIAKSQIPRTLGNKYRDVAVSCLEGLKTEEEEGLLNDQDGIVVGSAYISQIIGKLEEISM